MDDRFLERQRRAPRGEFASALRERLTALERDAEARPARRGQRWLVAGLAAAALAVAFTFPTVRAAAQQMLDVFRVRDFAVVQVDAARIQQLENRHLDPSAVLGGKVETVHDGGPPQRFASVDAAIGAAGFTPARPTLLPAALAPESVFVTGAATVRMTVDEAKLRTLLESLDVRDLALPPGLDQAPIEVRRPTVVVQTFAGPRHRRVALVQCASPEVSLPRGLDLARLGEIGMRVLGVAPAEAHRIATSIDWRSTLVVPVMSSATRFQQLDVNGARGLLLETTQTQTPGGPDRGPGRVLLWTHDNRVYAVMGDLESLDIVQIAQSVH